jgi:drug/metabolite transporter (DMT)-like permease
LVARTIFQAGRSPRSLAGLHRNDLCMTAATPLTTGRDDRSIRLTGIALMLAGTGLFSFNDALGKYLVATYSVGQLLLLRAFVALVLLSPFVWRARAEFKAIPRPGLQLLRVVLAASEVAAFFFATIYLPLADVITFYMAAPIFVTALSALVLGEHVGWRRWSAVAIGFCGVLIALKPSAQTVTWPALIALGGSLAFAVLMVVTRFLRGTSDMVLASSQFAAAMLLGAVWAPFAWVPPGPRDLGLFFCGACLSVVALLCVNRSLKLAAASVVVPYQYTMIIWAGLFGYLVFGDVPSTNIVLGGAVIVGAGLYIFLRERNLASAETPASMPPA